MNLTCPTLPNILMVSGINSDSDHLLEWLLMKRELMPTVLLVLPKKILIVTKTLWETELYLSSSNLGKKLLNQLIVLVLMILVDKKLMSVKILLSNIPMSTVSGSMSIMDMIQYNKKYTLLSLVKIPTKPLLSQLFLIMLLQLNLSST